MDKTSLGDRMRGYIEVANTRLVKRTPVIVFVDGKKFHNYTREMTKPFSKTLIENMQVTAIALCEEIEGARIAFTQSDEISILVTNYTSLEQGAYFDFRVQKIASIAASTATEAFNGTENLPYGAKFDARCFNLPREEVANYFVWRQQDWTRNSVQMLARSKFTQEELYKKDQNAMQEMLFKEHNINWNDLSTVLKRGSCVTKDFNIWRVDDDIPIFTQNREYIERYVWSEGES